MIKKLNYERSNKLYSLWYRLEFEDDMYIDRIRKVVKYKMINYKCENCDECFTTTESDTIVVNSINKGIRCEKRKSKIKKYVP